MDSQTCQIKTQFNMLKRKIKPGVRILEFQGPKLTEWGNPYTSHILVLGYSL